jgi:D-glycero-alpha-D-manno-heptose-7-phosphate kinase
MPGAPRAKRVAARAPTRIDLGGGWTDVPPYCHREGGFVCNVAIDRYAIATLTEYRPEESTAPPPHGVAPMPEDALIGAALRRSGTTGLHASLANDFPVGAGLGGSSAASAALLGALAAWRGEPWNRSAIAEHGRRIEVEELGIAGGRQDHYAATHGGALSLRFSKSVEVARIALAPEVCDALERRSVLVYTNESRISGDTISGVLNAYLGGDSRVINALARMKQLAEEMSAALDRGDIDHIGVLVGEHWVHQRSLHPAIPTARIDEIVARARAGGALGAKAMGASGGGCVLVIAADESIERVRRAVEPLGTLIPFRVDLDGLAPVTIID